MDLYKQLMKKNFTFLYYVFVIFFAMMLCGWLLYQRGQTTFLSERASQILMNEELYSKLTQDRACFTAQKEVENGLFLEEMPSKEILQLYYAQLAGFGELRTAEKYVASLHARGIQAFIRTYEYRTPRRKRLSKWYQVVTDKMPHGELVVLLDTLSQADRLTGSIICKCDE